MAQSKGGEPELKPIPPVERANATADSSDGEGQTTNYCVPVTMQPILSGGDGVCEPGAGVEESESDDQPKGSKAICNRGEAEAGSISSVERPNATNTRSDDDAQTTDGLTVTS